MRKPKKRKSPAAQSVAQRLDRIEQLISTAAIFTPAYGNALDRIVEQQAGILKTLAAFTYPDYSEQFKNLALQLGNIEEVVDTLFDHAETFGRQVQKIVKCMQLIQGHLRKLEESETTLVQTQAAATVNLQGRVKKLEVLIFRKKACTNYSRPRDALGGPCLNCGCSQPEHVRSV